MKSDTPQVTAAKVEVGRARAQLMGTAHNLQARLAPRTLARGAWEAPKPKGADLAEDAVDAVRRGPYAAGGIVAAIALFIAREPLMDLAERLLDRNSSDTETEDMKTETVE